LKNTSFNEKRIRRIGKIENGAAQQPIQQIERPFIPFSGNTILIFSVIFESCPGN